MSKISNIGVLNIVDIKEELAKEITELHNIGILIESDRSQVLLSHSKKINIGTTIKIPSDMNIKIISKNGKIKIDRDFLEGITDPIVFLVNGSMEFDNDIDVKLFDEKIYRIMLNGTLDCPNRLKGIIESKSVVNGLINSYKNEYKYFGGNVKLNNKFLKGLKPNSKLAFDKLMIIEEIDVDLFEKKISNIQAINRLVLIDKYEDNILPYIDESYEVDTVILPEGENGVKYLNDNIKIDDNSIKTYARDILYVEGDVEIYLKEDIQFKDYIVYLKCDTVISDENTYNLIKDSLGKDVEVNLIKGRLIKNVGKMVLTDSFEDYVTITNMGKLVIDNQFNFDNFNEKVVSIINYGAIEVPKGKMSLLDNKIKENFGKIKESSVEEEIKIKKEETDILYSNIGELKL